MPSPFDITTVSNTVTLDNNRTGVAVFTVKNNTRRRIHSTARLTLQPPSGEKWLTLLPPESPTDTANTREFPIDGTQSYQVKIAVPTDAAPGAYTMTLTLADDNNPDDNYSVSPGILFTVSEIPKPQPKPFPVWIIPAVIIAVIVIIALIVIAVTSSNNANANATSTAVAQTQSVFATQTAVAAATQTALNVFVGDWIPLNGGDTLALGQLSITSTGSNLVNITFTSTCLPGSPSCSVTPQVFSVNNVPFTPVQLAAVAGNMFIIIQPAGETQLLVTLSNSTIFGTFTDQIPVVRSSVRPPVSTPDVSVSFAPISQQQIDQIMKLAAEAATAEATTTTEAEAVTETPTPG